MIEVSKMCIPYTCECIHKKISKRRGVFKRTTINTIMGALR